MTIAKINSNIKEKCLTRYQIKESMQLIKGTDYDFITPTGKIYRYHKEIHKYYPVSISKNKYNGYLYANINYKGRPQITRRIHILVAETYVYNPDPENLKLVGHKDNNKTNDSFYNLYWTNNQDNINKAIKDGLLINKCGIEANDSIPIKVVDLKGNLIATYGSVRETVRYIKNLDLGYLSKITKYNNDYKPRNKKYKYFKITREEYNSIGDSFKELQLEENEKMIKQHRLFRATNLVTGATYISDNQKQFAKEHNLHQASISHCLINNCDFDNIWRFEAIKNIDIKDSSGYDKFISLTKDVIIENIKTKERLSFKTIKELKNYFNITGNDVKNYLKNNHLIFGKWKIIQYN